MRQEIFENALKRIRQLADKTQTANVNDLSSAAAGSDPRDLGRPRRTELRSNAALTDILNIAEEALRRD